MAMCNLLWRVCRAVREIQTILRGEKDAALVLVAPSTTGKKSGMLA